jgi:hypothetical protein
MGREFPITNLTPLFTFFMAAESKVHIETLLDNAPTTK